MTQTLHRFPANGCWLELYSTMIAEMVGHAGYDYAMIDMEHGPGTVDNVLPMIQAVQLGGAKALARIPETDPRWIGRLMDLGADGVMVPMVNTAQQARLLAAACLYAPDGSRGLASTIVRASRYGADVRYMEQYRHKFLLMVQIETTEGAANAAAIAATVGVDAVFVGPYDLSASLGHTGKVDHPEVQQCIADIAEAVKHAGKRLASLPTPGRSISDLYAQGFDLVLGGADVVLVRQAMENDAAIHREAMAT